MLKFGVSSSLSWHRLICAMSSPPAPPLLRRKLDGVHQSWGRPIQRLKLTALAHDGTRPGAGMTGIPPESSVPLESSGPHGESRLPDPPPAPPVTGAAPRPRRFSTKLVLLGALLGLFVMPSMLSLLIGLVVGRDPDASQPQPLTIVMALGTLLAPLLVGLTLLAFGRDSRWRSLGLGLVIWWGAGAVALAGWTAALIWANS